MHLSCCGRGDDIMGSRFILTCLTVLALVAYCNTSPGRRSGTSRKSNKPSEENRPPQKKETRVPGQLSYGGKNLDIKFNHTEELVIYKANYTWFPDDLFYPYSKLQGFNSSEEEQEAFLKICINSTMKKNSDIISKYILNDDVYKRIERKVLKHLCLQNYGREPNRANQCTRGLWVITLVALFSFALLKSE
ncbi:prion-like protein doppel [Bombina bombina]|uniref:prion-like protein doppel n=1 Tax=Bombina bombina TaxID=8345 RepID=UPI00235AB068|nr:prion-like protein doppel [Bombina bombina]